MIKNIYLNKIVNNIKTDITNVLLNDTVVVSNFLYQQVSNDIFELEILIPSTIKRLINFKCLLEDGTVISDNNVNIEISRSETTLIYSIKVRGE